MSQASDLLYAGLTRHKALAWDTISFRSTAYTACVERDIENVVRDQAIDYDGRVYSRIIIETADLTTAPQTGEIITDGFAKQHRIQKWRKLLNYWQITCEQIT